MKLHYNKQSSYRCSKIKSEEIGTKMDICVVDAGANLVAFAEWMAHGWDLLTFHSKKQKHLHGSPWTLNTIGTTDARC
jgi:hypothetical protein